MRSYRLRCRRLYRGGGGSPPENQYRYLTGIDCETPPPACRIVDPLPGSQRLMGLPDIEVFAFRLTAIVMLGLAGLALAFGWWVGCAATGDPQCTALDPPLALRRGH